MTIKNVTRYALVLLLGALSACGSENASTVVAPVTSVDTITAGKIMYSRPSYFTVNGTALTGAKVTASGGCSTVSEVVGGNATARRFSCSPQSLNDVVISVTSGSTEITHAAFTVPKPQVTFTTDVGSTPIVVELDPSKAPKSVNNFLLYVWDGFYTNTNFHRVVTVLGGGFGIVQGGGYGTDGVIKPASHPTLELEPPSVTGLSNVAFTIAMARTSALNSATSQFYFNTVNNASFDLPAGQGYAVFGKVVSGKGEDVVSAIGAVTVTSNVPETGKGLSAPHVLLSAVQTQ